MKTLPTEVKTSEKRNDKGVIHVIVIKTPYDDNDILQSSFTELEHKQNEPSLGDYNKGILAEMFFRFGSPYIN